jgi:hypothetical protein
MQNGIKWTLILYSHTCAHHYAIDGCVLVTSKIMGSSFPTSTPARHIDRLLVARHQENASASGG